MQFYMQVNTKCKTVLCNVLYSILNALQVIRPIWYTAEPIGMFCCINDIVATVTTVCSSCNSYNSLQQLHQLQHFSTVATVTTVCSSCNNLQQLQQFATIPEPLVHNTVSSCTVGALLIVFFRIGAIDLFNFAVKPTVVLLPYPKYLKVLEDIKYSRGCTRSLIFKENIFRVGWNS